MRYTPQRISKGPQCTFIDDLILLPRRALPQEIVEAEKEIKAVFDQGVFPDISWERDILPSGNDESEKEMCILFLAWDRILQKAIYERGFDLHAPLPEWTEVLPELLRGDIMHARTERHCDPLAISWTPYCLVSYIIQEDGFTQDVYDSCGLVRLHDIAQLGYLQYPVFDEDMRGMEVEVRSHRFRHSRMHHSYDVMVLATLIGANNGLSDRDMVHLRFVALTHDMFTPAGGDTTKTIDPKGLDEDACYPQLFSRPIWKDLKARYALDESHLLSIIANKGALGQILDFADKMAYTGRDTHMLIGPPRFETSNLLSLQKEITSQVYNRFGICAFWDKIEVRGDQVVVTDPDALGHFLELRLKMFARFYAHPAARFQEYSIAMGVMAYLYETGELTKERLQCMRDQELDDLINAFLGVQYLGAFLGPKVMRESFDDLQKAKAREQELVDEGVVFCFVDTYLLRPLKTGIEKLVVDDGKVCTYLEARNAHARRLQAMSLVSPSVHVYWSKAPQISDEAHEALLQWRKGQMAHDH